MVWSIFPYENSYIEATREEINGVPCIKFRPKGFEGLLPTVVNYHGWHSSKDFKRFEAQIIASHGYQVIAPDALHHGDRDAIDHDDPENLDKYLWRIVLQSVEESTKLIEGVISEHQADPARIAVMGTSMGAITAGGVLTANPDIKCLMGFSGAFAWQEAINCNHLPAAASENKELIEAYDLMSNSNKIKDTAILILHGTEDTSLPIDTQRIFYNRMIPLYAEKPEKLSMVEAANVNHHTTTGMLERAVMWLKEQL